MVDAASLLAHLAERPQAAAILLDVDGTLAPIVPRPEDARVPDETREELRRLAGRYRLVACISGRPGEDAARIVGVEGIRYVGEHGLELEPEAEEWAERLAAFARGVEWPAEEGKRLTLSFHFRTAPEGEEYLRVVAERALEDGLRPRWGRKVLEVRPPLDADKGTAVRRLLEEAALRRALYAGDDTTDLDAFRALDDLEVAVCVAVVSEEGPSDLGEQADLAVGDPEQLTELLRML
jgi:trehalose 6-phosphate phosphatase